MKRIFVLSLFGLFALATHAQVVGTSNPVRSTPTFTNATFSTDGIRSRTPVKAETTSPKSRSSFFRAYNWFAGMSVGFMEFEKADAMDYQFLALEGGWINAFGGDLSQSIAPYYGVEGMVGYDIIGDAEGLIAALKGDIGIMLGKPGLCRVDIRLQPQLVYCSSYSYAYYYRGYYDGHEYDDNYLAPRIAASVGFWVGAVNIRASYDFGHGVGIHAAWGF